MTTKYQLKQTTRPFYHHLLSLFHQLTTKYQLKQTTRPLYHHLLSLFHQLTTKYQLKQTTRPLYHHLLSLFHQLTTKYQLKQTTRPLYHHLLSLFHQLTTKCQLKQTTRPLYHHLLSLFHQLTTKYQLKQTTRPSYHHHHLLYFCCHFLMLLPTQSSAFSDDESSSSSSSSSCSFDCSDCSKRSHRCDSCFEDQPSLPSRKRHLSSPSAERVKKQRLEYKLRLPTCDTPPSLDPLYSPTMPPFSPETREYVPSTIQRVEKGPEFPPKPISIPLNPGRDRYAFLSHDPRTLFAGAPSSFSRIPDARYASKLRNRALQIGCKPEDVSYCVRGHTITKTETAKHKDFYYQLTTTFSPTPRATRFKTGSTQTDVELPRFSKDCHGCGHLFTCL